jgi:hypothetical protein
MIFLKTILIATAILLGSHGLHAQPKKFDFLDYRGNKVKTHELRGEITISSRLRALGEFHHQPIYEGKQFDVSLVGFAAGDVVVLVHAEKHTDGSGGLDYTNLPPANIGKIRFNMREQCVTSAEVSDPYANPELRFLRDKGFPITLPMYLRQYFATSKNGTSEIVVTYGKLVRSCEPDTIGPRFKAEAERDLSSLVKVKIP